MSPRHFVDALRARRTLAAGLFALGLLGAALVTVAMPERFVASARVLVEVSPGELAPGATLAAHLATQVDIVTSQRVALRVVDALGLAEDPAAIRRWRLETDAAGSLRHLLSDVLRRDLRVEPAGGSSVIRIDYAADDAAAAARIANAFAQAYVELGEQAARAADARRPAEPDAAALRARVAAALQRVAAALSESDASPERAGTLRTLREELRQLQLQLEQAERAFDPAASSRSDGRPRGAASGPRVSVLSPATEPVRPVRPDPVLNAVVGAALGSLAALFGVALAERRDRRIRGARDLADASGRPPIGSLRDAFGRDRPASASRHGLGGMASPAVPPSAPARVAGGVEADGPATRPVPTRDTAASPEPIGQILVKAGLIHPPEVERILAWARREGMRFGEAAVASRLVTSDQVERALAAQFDYPMLVRGASPVSEEVVAAYDARNPMVADLRRLRARIRAAQAAAPPATPLRCVAVVSAGPGEGKSFLAANLAVSFAQGGQRTLLIDADLRAGRLHRMFGLPNATGLSAMLNRSIQPGAMQRVPGLGTLTVLTRGPDAPNPTELLSREALGQLLEAFARSFDLVILDTAGGGDEPDASLVARCAGAALVLARKDRSSFDGLAELVQGGGAVPAVPVIGTVLNEA
ncbi:MAG: P-loop NTPase [Burkholderiales bacterium]